MTMFNVFRHLFIRSSSWCRSRCTHSRLPLPQHCPSFSPESSYGVVDKKTLIYVEKDETPEYKRIHIVPFQDTLPRSYQYDVFNDYLKPYCKAHANQR